MCLLGLPLRLLIASQEHHDTLVRELRLMALAPSRGSVLTHATRASADTGLVALVEELGVRHAAARARRDSEIQESLDAGLLQIDQVFAVPVAAAEEMRRLVGLLAAADLYCDQTPCSRLPARPWSAGSPPGTSRRSSARSPAAPRGGGRSSDSHCGRVGARTAPVHPGS